MSAGFMIGPKMLTKLDPQYVLIEQAEEKQNRSLQTRFKKVTVEPIRYDVIGDAKAWDQMEYDSPAIKALLIRQHMLERATDIYENKHSSKLCNTKKHFVN